MDVELVSLDSLVHDAENARTHPEKNLDAIRASIEEFGQVEPLVVRAGTNVVIGGNGRLAAMRELGFTECAVAYVDVSDAQAKALGIALNRTSDLAEWNVDQLSEILSELVEDDPDLAAAAGFSVKELEAFLSVDPPPMDEPPEEGEDDSEISLDDLEKDTNNECPRCGFRY